MVALRTKPDRSIASVPDGLRYQLSFFSDSFVSQNIGREHRALHLHQREIWIQYFVVARNVLVGRTNYVFSFRVSLRNNTTT